MKPRLHPNVVLAEGMVVPEEAWQLHGEILQCGIPRHRVVVKGFRSDEKGMLIIVINISPLDGPIPLRQRES